MENKIITYLGSLWSQTIAPSWRAISDKNQATLNKIVSAIENKPQIKEVAVNNLEDALEPMLEAQNATTIAIKNIPVQVFPEVNFSSLESKLDELRSSFEKKDLTVNIGETKLEFSPVIKAIENLQKSIPKMEKQEVIDYTLMFDEMMKIMEKPQDTTHMQMMCDMLSRLGTSDDLVAMTEWLKVIASRTDPDPIPFQFDENGRVLVAVDKFGGGGGGGLTQDESIALQSISEFGIPPYDTQVIDETSAPATTTITYKKNNVVVAIKTITVAGAVTTISVTL